MGLYGLLLGGWSSVMAMMTDSAGAVRLRTVMLFVIVAAISYRTLREMDRLPDGATGMVTGGLVGLLAGGAVASLVKFFGPAAIVPAMVAVLAFAMLRWVVRSVGRAAAVIEQTTAEFAVAAWPHPEPDPGQPTQVTAHQVPRLPGPDPRDVGSPAH